MRVANLIQRRNTFSLINTCDKGTQSHILLHALLSWYHSKSAKETMQDRVSYALYHKIHFKHCNDRWCRVLEILYRDFFYMITQLLYTVKYHHMWLNCICDPEAYLPDKSTRPPYIQYYLEPDYTVPVWLPDYNAPSYRPCSSMPLRASGHTSK